MCGPSNFALILKSCDYGLDNFLNASKRYLGVLAPLTTNLRRAVFRTM